MKVYAATRPRALNCRAFRDIGGPGVVQRPGYQPLRSGNILMLSGIKVPSQHYNNLATLSRQLNRLTRAPAGDRRSNHESRRDACLLIARGRRQPRCTAVTGPVGGALQLNKRSSGRRATRTSHGEPLDHRIRSPKTCGRPPRRFPFGGTVWEAETGR